MRKKIEKWSGKIERLPLAICFFADPFRFARPPINLQRKKRSNNQKSRHFYFVLS